MAVDESIDISTEHEEVLESWNQDAINQGEWGGCPWLDTKSPLQLEGGYPFQAFNNMSFNALMEQIAHIRVRAYYMWEAAGKPDGRDMEFWLAAETEYINLPEKDENGDWELVNHWFSQSKNADIYIWRNKVTQKIESRTDKNGWQTRLRFIMRTYHTSDVWSLKAEMKAIEKLQSMVSPLQFKDYILTGCFTEQSKRSCLDYLFRKGRPTLVFNKRGLITALCSHAIGYYRGTWAGVFVPTDDVIAHLIRMRHEEYNFWKKSNQHPPYAEEAAV